MEAIINISNEDNLKQIIEFVNNFGAKSKIINSDEKENIGLYFAIEEGDKNDLVLRDDIFNELEN